MGDGHWETPHPGTRKIEITASFEEAMEKWFEGYNLPKYRSSDGEIDSFETDYERVKNRLWKKRTPSHV